MYVCSFLISLHFVSLIDRILAQQIHYRKTMGGGGGAAGEAEVEGAESMGRAERLGTW